MTASKLIRPSADYKEDYLAALEEYHAEGRYLYQDIARLTADFDTFIKELRAEKDTRTNLIKIGLNPSPKLSFGWLRTINILVLLIFATA